MEYEDYCPIHSDPFDKAANQCDWSQINSDCRDRYGEGRELQIDFLAEYIALSDGN